VRGTGICPIRWSTILLVTTVAVVGLKMLLKYKIVLIVMVEWLTLLLHARVVLCSNLGPETGHTEVCCGFPKCLQANAGVEP
jgi:purine-cytosine permease-like protein